MTSCAPRTAPLGVVWSSVPPTWVVIAASVKGWGSPTRIFSACLPIWWERSAFGASDRGTNVPESVASSVGAGSAKRCLRTWTLESTRSICEATDFPASVFGNSRTFMLPPAGDRDGTPRCSRHLICMNLICMIGALALPCCSLVPKGICRLQQVAHMVVVLACAFASLACSSYDPTTRGQRRGGQLYRRMCAVCHGPTGTGYRADQAPAVTHPEFLGSVSNDFLRRAIAAGRPGTTMSAWSRDQGGPLAPTDVDALVTFIRAWQRHAVGPLDERPVAGDASRGGEVYARECARCHGEI